MHLRDYTFVALDLETTGLSPETDTIIEVAAVKFHLVREGDVYHAVDMDERSMLIHPGRAMTEEISMITGITDAMLDGKPSWESVRERVRDFIGDDSIIVGHNVLFDIVMFGTHGIDLSTHITLDTFELSEIFSRDAESLNLGFLGKKYAIHMESEHRALDDTKLSIGLFCRYLSDIVRMDDTHIALWQHARGRDTSHLTETLLDITGLSERVVEPYRLHYHDTPDSIRATQDGEGTYSDTYTLIDLRGDQSQELDIIASLRKAILPLLIITPEKKTALYQKILLQNHGYSVHVFEDVGHFCSIEMLEYALSSGNWERKETIFLLKLASWLHETETGLLDELKYYGEERTRMELFRCQESERNIFRAREQEKMATADIFIADVGASIRNTGPLLTQPHHLIMRDIICIEDRLRRGLSKIISFEHLFELTYILCGDTGEAYFDDIITGLSLMRDIYMSVPDRPTGPSAVAPGDFGETYCITQAALWHRGYTWLQLASKKLRESRVSFRAYIPSNPIEKIYREKLLGAIDMLIHFADISDTNTSIIVHISGEDMSLSFIPRDIRDDMSKLLRSQGGEQNLLLGYGIANPDTERFLENECGLIGDITSTTTEQIIHFDSRIGITEMKTVILTTSTKHVRSIMQDLQKAKKYKLYGQGVSGGKSKMMTLFRASKEPSVLIGLIDSYIDESSFWQDVDTLIIAKIPFDPPTDPYFLARTVGMKNNFEEYSTPIALSTINTLIGRAKSSNKQIDIICSDERIDTVNWGKSLKNKIL